MKVMSKDLKKNIDYFLTYDYFPKGGTKVKVIGTVQAKKIWAGHRGIAFKVEDDDGNQYFIHPKSYIFDTDPKK